MADFGPEVEIPSFLRMRNDKMVNTLDNVGLSRLIKYPAFLCKSSENADKIIRDVVKSSKLQLLLNFLERYNDNVLKVGNKRHKTANVKSSLHIRLTETDQKQQKS